MSFAIRTLLVFTLMAACAFSIAATPPDDSVMLNATEDSYVVADINDPNDAQGLRDKNFGGLDFLKIWYANQVQATEQVVSVGLIKFDLSQVADRDIRSAHLQLFAQRADLLQPVRLVDVSLAEGAWNQNDVTFKTLPQISQPPLASAAVYGANVWYSWDVTPAVVRKAKDGNVAYAVGLRTLENKGEEQVVFASSKAGRNAPRLMVTMAPAAAAIPPYFVAGGVVLAAVLAFGGGLLFGRRRRRAMAHAGSLAQAVPVARPAGVEVEEDPLMECPTCHRQIPAVAETCPRCGARVAEATVR